MTEEILALAKALGHVEKEQEDVLRELCVLAQEELKRRLRKDIEVEDCESAFRLGAAWLALAGLCAAKAAEDDVESFTAGSVTIRRGGGKLPLERSAGLRAQAEQVMGPYMEDACFQFMGVQG